MSWICMHGVDIDATGACSDCEKSLLHLLAPARPFHRRTSRPYLYEKGYQAGYKAGLRASAADRGAA